MKITFLIPPALDCKLPAERIFGCNYGIYYQPNIFILYPVTILKKLGYDVAIKDCVVEKISKKYFLEYIKKDRSDIYAFYTVFLSKKTDLMARELIRKIKSEAKFIYMSTEPSNNPQDFIDSNSFVIRGETEETIKELIGALKNNTDLSNIKGISYMTGNEIKHNASRGIISDLDSLPFPDRDMLDSRHYYNPKLSKRPFSVILTSRGCAYKCYYCVPNSLSFAREMEFKAHSKDLNKPPVRLRSAGNVIAEFEYLHKKGFKSISVLDDQFAWDKKRTIEICNGIKGFNFEWSCLCRADHITDEDVVKAMAQAGCKYIDIGVESFVQEILDDIRKDMDISDIFKAVSLLKKYNIEQELNILLGSSPLETESTIEYTLGEVKKLDVDYVLFSICTPFPGTEFYKAAKKNKWMIEDEYRAIDPIKESFISYPGLPKEKLDKIIRKAYMDFYFSPEYIFKKIRKVRNLKDFVNKAKAAMSILR